MRTRRQVVLFALTWITAALAVVVLVLEFRPDQVEPKPTVALRYDVEAIVSDDGGMEVVERFRYAFDRDRVQLQRFYAANGQVPTGWAVLRDGAPEKFSFGPSGDGYLLVVGHGAGRGVHDYEFRYRVPDVLHEVAAGAPRGFHQQLVSAGFASRILTGRVTVTFPARLTLATCLFGVGPCAVERIDARTIAIPLRNLPPQTSVDVTAVVARTN